MKNTSSVFKKIINYLVIAALLFTIIPISGEVKAATSQIAISNPMGTIYAPAQVLSNTISVEGSFSGVTNLKYKVTQIRLINAKFTAGKSTGGSSRIHTDGSSFEFKSVKLYEGLNEIIVLGTDKEYNVIKSQRVYVEYTNVPVIKTVIYNKKQDLKKNNVINKSLTNDELTITGSVLNAKSIVAKVNGESTDYKGYISSNNTYTIKHIPLRRGKNTVELVAKNSNKEYPTTIEVIYDDGKPYVSETTHITTNDNFVEMGKINNFTDGKLKFRFNNEEFTISYNDYANYKLPIKGRDKKTNRTYKFTKLAGNRYQIEYEIASVKKNDTNVIQLTFTGLKPQTYHFNYVGNKANYVTKVSGITGTTTSKRLDFYVYTKDKTNIHIAAKDESGSPLTVNLVGNPVKKATDYMYKATVYLEPGNNIITVRPNGADSTTNMKRYNVFYINSPDVKIYNLANGDRVGTNENLDVDSKLVGKLLNIDSDDRDKTTITIKNSGGTTTYALKTGPGGNFAANETRTLADDFEFQFYLVDKLEIGSNDVTINVTDGTTTTKTSLTLSYYSGGIPYTTLEIDEESSRDINPYVTFTEYKDGKYKTEASYIYLKGEIANTSEFSFYVNGSRAVKAKMKGVNTEDDHSKEFKVTKSIKKNNFTMKLTASSETSGKYETKYPIYLKDGTNVIKVRVVGKTGKLKTQTLYIEKIKPQVKLVSPVLSREDVINSNYVEVMVQAYHGAKVTINEQKAELVKLSDNELRKLISDIGAVSLYDKYGKYGNYGKDGYLSHNELAAIDQSEFIGSRYKADVLLNKGENKIEYEVAYGNTKKTYEFTLTYAASPEEGARYKTPFANDFNVFDDEISLVFPDNTWLVKPDDQYKSMNEYINKPNMEFAIVDKQTGRLEKEWDYSFSKIVKVKDPISGVYSYKRVYGKYVFKDLSEPYRTIMLREFDPPTGTGYAGDVYWISAEGNILELNSGYIPTNQGTLTLKYDPNIVIDSRDQLAIYYFDPHPKNPKESKWINVGGVVDRSAKTVTTNIDKFGYYTVMSKRGLLEPVDKTKTNHFGLTQPITRGEFASIIVKALNLPINAGPYRDDNKTYPINPTFDDVSPELEPENKLYTYEYIETAARAGIVEGSSYRIFDPEELLTNEEAAVMIARALNSKLESDDYKAAKALQKTFDDIDKISEDNYKYVLAATDEGIMEGEKIDGSTVFNPKSFLTRMEADKIAYKLMGNK